MFYVKWVENMGINITVGGRGLEKESESYKLRHTLILTVMKKFIQLKNYLIYLNNNFVSAKIFDKTQLSLKNTYYKMFY